MLSHACSYAHPFRLAHPIIPLLRFPPKGLVQLSSMVACDKTPGINGGCGLHDMLLLDGSKTSVPADEGDLQTCSTPWTTALPIAGMYQNQDCYCWGLAFAYMMQAAVECTFGWAALFEDLKIAWQHQFLYNGEAEDQTPDINLALLSGLLVASQTNAPFATAISTILQFK